MANPSSDSRINAPKPGLPDSLQGGSATDVPRGYETDDGPLSPAQISALQAAANEDLPKGAVVRRTCLFLKERRG